MIGSAEHDRAIPAAASAGAALDGGPQSPITDATPAVRPTRRRLLFGGLRADAEDLTDDRVRPGAWVPIVLFALVVAGFLFRLAAAEHLSSHVDESASVLAARMVADKGVPVFPSGTLYLQGATISYLAAPILWLGRGGLDDLLPLRLISVVAGTAAILVAFLAARTMLGRSGIAVFVAGLLTIDPVSIRWGGMVRMYALLQLLALLVIWLLARALARTPVRRELLALTALFWVGVFTHIAICLLLPGMVLAAALTYGKALLEERRDLGLALAACFGAPVVLMGLNNLVSPSDKAASTALPGVSFVGDFLFSSDQVLHPSVASWTQLFGYAPIGVILPVIVLVASAILIGRYLFGEPGRSPGVLARKRMLTLLLALYWLPIVAVAMVATEQNERYLIHIHPFGLLLVAMLIDDLASYPFPRARLRTAGVSLATAAAARPWGPRRVESLTPGATMPGAPARPSIAPERALPAWLSTRAIAAVGFATVCLVGTAVRISHLSHLSLWLDEGFSVLYSRQAWTSVSGTHGFYSPHPPLYFTLVKVSDLVAPDELAGRLISVVAGIATIPLFYAIIRMVLDRRAAFVSALVLALSPIHLYYSQEARMYALVVFLITLSYYALVSYHYRPRLAWAALYGVAAALALWVDYSSVYALAPQAVFILVQFYRHRRASLPLLVAGVLAVVAYLPWVPQVLASIDAANQVERRESYLGVGQERISTAILAMIGFAGDGSYFQSLRPTAWNRWPDSRFVLVLAALPVVVLGARMLWRRWAALTLVAGLLGTMLVGIWISLISPGFAERTVLTTSLGWAALLGAAFSGKMHRALRAVALASLAAVLLIQTSTIGVIYNGAIKQLWQPASDDVAMVAPLNIPLVTYSYGAVADTLVDVYHPGLLDGMRVITIRDGNLENVLSNGVIPEVGLTRTYDLPAGKLAEALPETPDNDLVWYLYYTREGESDVRAAIRRLGYSRVLHNHYVAPRYQVFLDLYARPGARIGAPIAIDGTFAATDAGWTLPSTGATVTPADPSGAPPTLTLTNQANTIAEAFMLVDQPGAGLATVSAEFNTTGPAGNVIVTVACLSAGGAPLATQSDEVEDIGGAAGTWRPVRVTALCPAETESLRISLANTGIGEVSYRSPTLDYLPIPGVPHEP